MGIDEACERLVVWMIGVHVLHKTGRAHNLCQAEFHEWWKWSLCLVLTMSRRKGRWRGRECGREQKKREEVERSMMERNLEHMVHKIGLTDNTKWYLFTEALVSCGGGVGRREVVREGEECQRKRWLLSFPPHTLFSKITRKGPRQSRKFMFGKTASTGL